MNLNPEKKIAGVFVPLFALRREGDLGIGDTAALLEFIDWAADHAFRIVQILPVNETGADNSPYNAVSSTALDPVLLQTDPGALKDLDEEAFALTLEGVDAAKMQKGDVRYAEVKVLKRRLLRLAFESFQPKRARGTGRAKKFDAFCGEHGAWLEDYTLFRVLMEKHATEQWDLWPEEHRTAAATRAWLKKQPVAVRRGFRKEMDFCAYIQWIAFSQWGSVKKHADKRGVALMGDVPIGVSYYSSDVFSRGEIFDLTWSGGAPPERIFKSDPFTEKWGQNWGVPLYRWDVLKEHNYDWWRQRVKTVREVFHLFRIDHVLGFYRIFSFPWRPQENAEFLPLSPQEAAARTGGRLPGFLPREDSTWENREANRVGGEELLRMVLEEVGEHRLVGEDLGVVPEYVRPSLASLGIAGFKIPQWETAWDGRLLPGGSYNRLSLVTYATHDHEPLRVLWEKWTDVLCRHAKGDASLEQEAAAARDAMQKLLDFTSLGIQADALPFNDEIREGLLEALFRSNSWIAVSMLTDYFGTSERFNVPGAVADSNWSTRMGTCTDAWEKDAALSKKMKRITAMIRASGRD